MKLKLIRQSGIGRIDRLHDLYQANLDMVERISIDLVVFLAPLDLIRLHLKSHYLYDSGEPTNWLANQRGNA